MFTDHCVYTIAHSDKLCELVVRGRGTLPEKKRWVLGKKLLDEAEQSGRRLPIIFAPAEKTAFLFAWALLERIALGRRKTVYTFSKLRFFRESIRKTTLRVASVGRRLASNRPYQICKTPRRLLELAAGRDCRNPPGDSPYWLIKGRPRLDEDLRLVQPGDTDTWWTKRRLPAWKRGDCLFIWEAAPTMKVVAVAELDRPDAGYYAGKYHFTVRFLTPHFGDRGPGIDQLRLDRALKPATFLKAGPSGTVYPLTE